MFRDYNIYDLFAHFQPDLVTSEYEDVPEYCGSDDIFMDAARYAARMAGFTNVKWSVVWEEDWNRGDWMTYYCEALGGRKKMIEGMVDENCDTEYLIHGIAQEESWSIGEDNSVKQKKKKVAICIQYESGDDRIKLETHEIGKCPYFVYDHQIMKKRKIKVTTTFYLSTKVKDMDNVSADVIDKAIKQHFDADYLAERVYEDLDYELNMDDDPSVDATVHKIDIKDVPRTRKI